MGAQLPPATLQQLQAHHQQQLNPHYQPQPMAGRAHPAHPHQQRPVSSYYGEYETVQKFAGQSSGPQQPRKTSAPSSPLKLNGSLGSSGRYQHTHLHAHHPAHPAAHQNHQPVVVQQQRL